jgi:translation initiation factor 4G
MARHGSQSSQSERQVPPSPRPNNRPPAGPYNYGYPNQPAYATGYNQNIPHGRGGNFRNPSGAQPFQPVGGNVGGMQQFQRPGGPQPPRSPQTMPTTIPQHAMYGLQHMPVQAAGSYVTPPYPSSPFPSTPQPFMDLTRGDLQYAPTQFDQQLQGQYIYQQFHQSQLQPSQHPPFNTQPPQQQLFNPSVPPPSYSPSRPVNQPMSRTTSEVNHLPQQTPTASSPAQKEEHLSFVKPKKNSAIRIVNPDTKAEITFPKVSLAKSLPNRTPSPVVKTSTPVKTIVPSRISHSPAPSTDVDRPSSAPRSKNEVTEEMKTKIQISLESQEAAEKEKTEREKAEKEKAEKEKAEKERAEKEEAERIEREKKLEEEKREKEEAERLEKERQEEEERKKLEELERIKREEEEAERKAEEERIAAEKARVEEAARIAKEKADEEAARLAKEKEEEQAAAAAAAEAAAEAASGSTVVVTETPVQERRASLGGSRKMAPPPITVKDDDSLSDGLQSAALKTASFIKHDDLLSTKYPTPYKSPDPAINAKFGSKGFHYDLEFLNQFRDVYKDKPSEDWDTKIKETMGDIDARNQRPISGPGRTVSSSAFQMGQFKPSPAVRPQTTLPSLSTGTQYTPITATFPPRPNRQLSAGGQSMQSPASPSGRTQSRSQRQNSRRAPAPPPPPAEPPIEPLPVNPNRWKPQRTETSLGPLPSGADSNKLTPDVVQRKVKSLLNKLTMEKFDKITDQILEIASQSRTETDGRTLRQIIQLTFEKATDEPNFSEMYALFCRKIMETIDPNITDPAVVNKDGQPLTGGQLFRKYLLNRCQEEFEKGWKVNLPPKPDEDAVGKEAELLSEEYYVAAKAKRQGLGLVQFIGELFKLGMLIEKIMYDLVLNVF